MQKDLPQKLDDESLGKLALLATGEHNHRAGAYDREIQQNNSRTRTTSRETQGQ
jgi:hypothetical protein